MRITSVLLGRSHSIDPQELKGNIRVIGRVRPAGTHARMCAYIRAGVHVCAGGSVSGRASIRVTGRVRPAERDEGACPVHTHTHTHTHIAGRDEGACPVHVDGDTNQLVVEHNSVRAAFNFDRCFGQDSSQEHVFDEVRARVLRSCALACGCACI